MHISVFNFFTTISKAMNFKNLFQLIYFVWLINTSLAAPPILAKPGCKDTCGNNVTIPYPFGIGNPNCFLDKWYEVVCHESKPYLNKYYGQEFGGEVLEVAVNSWTITINANNSRFRVCEDKGMWLAGNLSGSPFKYEYNTLTFIGCGNVMLANQTHLLDGCTSNCYDNRSINSCLGINCCEIHIEFIKQIYLNFSNLVSRNNSCPYVVFGSDPTTSNPFANGSQNPLGVTNPVLLRWEFREVENNTYCQTYETGEYYCRCPFCKEGNPFIVNGCQLRTDESFCIPSYRSASHSRKRLIILVAGGTTFGIAFLVTAGFLLYKLIRRRREIKLKENFFKRNGGLLLQQQLSVDENMVDKVRFFTSIELDKATDNFNENRVLGRGGQGTVYKGMLIDGIIVAVKKSKLDDKNQVEQFINEVVLLSQINHRNVVKLLGCCLETHVPLLVYEFIPNGTLYDLMHSKDDEFVMSWDMRLKIAIEVGGALAYLHSGTSVPIYHRDVKSSNILLDENHLAKVSDFGISRHVKIEQTHLTTMVKGTFGYLDPEYFQSNQFTDKSDVYSFGVVLVELLTREKPVPSTLTEGESSLGLAGQFLIYMEEDRLDMILDTQILETASDEEVRAVARLAQRCLSLNGRKRPTLKEVAMELESIKMSHKTSAVEQTTV